MPIDIRPARPEDVAHLAHIDGLVSASPWSEAQFIEGCSDPSQASLANGREFTLVLEAQNRIAGFVVFSRVLDEACIHNIAVHPLQQGRGLARRVLRAALERMRNEGVNCCQLEVRESNAAARALYQGFHFQLDGVRRNYYPAPNGSEDALLMSRQL